MEHKEECPCNKCLDKHIKNNSKVSFEEFMNNPDEDVLHEVAKKANQDQKDFIENEEPTKTIDDTPIKESLAPEEEWTEWVLQKVTDAYKKGFIDGYNATKPVEKL